LLALACVLEGPAALGSGYFQGEVLVGGWPAYQLGCGLSYIQAYTSSGVYQRDAAVMSCGLPRDAIMLGDDVLFAGFHGVIRMHSDGSLSLYIAGDPEGREYTSLAMDAQQNVFVATTTLTIRKFDSTGRLTGSYNVPADPGGGGVFWMDLGADQCTLFYATGLNGIHLKRYDVCRSVALTDFAALQAGDSFFGIRTLPDGGLLVGTRYSDILRLSSSGAVVHVFGVGAGGWWNSLSLSRDEQSFWAGSVGTNGALIMNFDLNSGAVLAGPIPTPVPSVPGYSIAPEFVLVVGEHRAAQPFFSAAPPRRRAVRNH